MKWATVFYGWNEMKHLLGEDDAVLPLTKEEFEKFAYHLGVASKVMWQSDPPEDFYEEFVGFGYRLLSSYERLSKGRWKSEERGG